MMMAAARGVKDWFDGPAGTRTAKLIAIVALVLSLFVAGKQNSLTDCLADYNEASAQSSAAARQAAEDDRKAENLLWNTVAENPRSALSAVRTYNASRLDAEQKRKDSPPPEPPSEYCR